MVETGIILIIPTGILVRVYLTLYDSGWIKQNYGYFNQNSGQGIMILYR